MRRQRDQLPARIRRPLHQHRVRPQRLQRMPHAPGRARAVMADAENVDCAFNRCSHESSTRNSGLDDQPTARPGLSSSPRRNAEGPVRQIPDTGPDRGLSGHPRSPASDRSSSSLVSVERHSSLPPGRYWPPLERQRRSVLQPRVGPTRVGSTLGSRPTRAQTPTGFRPNPFRVLITSRQRPRVAPIPISSGSEQPWAGGHSTFGAEYLLASSLNPTRRTISVIPTVRPRARPPFVFPEQQCHDSTCTAQVPKPETLRVLREDDSRQTQGHRP